MSRTLTLRKRLRPMLATLTGAPKRRITLEVLLCEFAKDPRQTSGLAVGRYRLPTQKPESGSEYEQQTR
jgi:hypothetical protein